MERFKERMERLRRKGISHISPEMLQLTRERDYKYYSMKKYGVFELGLDKLTIENAQCAGNIATVYAAKLEQGYGIVSMSRGWAQN